MNDRRCPTCGMPREDWPDNEAGGYMKDGQAHCCKGCAEGTGCTCTPVDAATRAPTQEEIRDDPASGAFVQSLQKETKTIGPGDYGSDTIEKKTPAADAGRD